MITYINTAIAWQSLASNLLKGQDIHHTIFLISVVVAMLIILIALYMIQRAVQTMYRTTFPESWKLEQTKKIEATQQRAEKRKLQWAGLLGLHKLEEEKDLVIENHDFDGIAELDNPIPIWFNFLFYSTIIFGIGYLFSFHVFGWGLNQDQEYVREVAQAEEARQIYLSQAANLVDETTVTVDSTGALAVAGKAIFSANCAACHGGQGEGGIGPNLTDNHWLHGGEIRDVFKTVKYGIPDKGMVPWEQTLTPGQIAEVSNYILSLRDSKPANPKAPEGIEVTYE